MGKMDLSEISEFGKEEKEEDSSKQDQNRNPGLEHAKKKKRKTDAQDRVVAAQIYFALAVILAFAAVKFVFPDFYATLQQQYEDFVTRPPVWDLDSLKEIFNSLKASFTVLNV